MIRSQALEKTGHIFVCKGSAFERGYQQGQSYTKQLQRYFNAFFESDPVHVLKVSWLPNRWATWLLSLRVKKQLSLPLKKHYPAQLAHMQGVAQGANLQPEQILLSCATDMLFRQHGFVLGHGSSVAIPKQLSDAAEPFLIKNVDCPYFLRFSHLLRHSQPDTGLSSIELTMVPWTGCHAGLNEAGVAISYNYAYSQSPLDIPIPIPLRIQQALETCQSAKEVVDFFQKGRQSGGALLTVLDASGELYAIEIASQCVNSKLIVNNPLIQTNHYQIPAMFSRDMPANACYTQTGITSLRGKRMKESSELRFDRLCELTGTKIQFQESDVRHYFSDHYQWAVGNDNTLCRHGPYYETTCSVVLKPKSREIQVALGSPCETEYQTFSL